MGIRIMLTGFVVAVAGLMAVAGIGKEIPSPPIMWMVLVAVFGSGAAVFIGAIMAIWGV